MKRINLKAQYPNFIGTWNIENESLCNEIVDLFEKNKNLQKPGQTLKGNDPEVKRTTDMTIIPNDLKDIKFKCLNDYINELYKCYLDYQEQWVFIKDMIKSVNIGAFNIQKYSPGDHFSQIHAERTSINHAHRIFAWMTYLNDVEDGGKTNFSHYDLKIKPEMGKTLIWPAEWTHAHSGEVLNSGVKHIITGWIHFSHNGDI